jgi:acetate---CoA ligase (ADP-forming)
VIAAQVANPGLSHNREIYREVSDAMDRCAIPVVPVLTSVTTCRELIGEFTAWGKSCFQDEVNLGSALGKVLRRPVIAEATEEPANYHRAAIEAILKGKQGALPSKSVAQVLSRAGFRLPHQVEATSTEGLERACGEIGFPLAMKVMGPLHKSDLGGVRLGIVSREAARSAWDGLMAIEGATGVVIQGMVEGNEVILGASREEDLGHLVMFGFGGIYTEVLKDVRFALTPLAIEECREMVRGIRAYPILEGVRGQKGMSVDLLADYTERLGWLVADFPAIREIDLNPVKGAGEELYVVDGRIIID